MVSAKDFVIFRAGDYPQGKYSEKDLDEMVETFNASEAPHIIIGHSSDYKGKTRIPSFGQILGGLKRVGMDLVAIGAEFHDKLAEWIKEGFYNQRSIELAEVNGKKRIVALGMLGACPPAVKGLPAMDEALDEIAMVFSEVVNSIEFSEKIEFDAVNETELLGKADTIKGISDCMAELTASLTTMINDDVPDDRITQEIYEHFDDVFAILRVHKGFIEKIERLEEVAEGEVKEEAEANTENEMSEKRSWIKEFKKFISSKKGDTVNKEQEQKYQSEIADLTAQVATLTQQAQEFSEQKRVAEEAKLFADQAVVDANLRAEIKSFLDANAKNLKIVDELKLSEVMFQIAKANTQVDLGDSQKPLFVVFQEMLTRLPSVQLGEAKEFQTLPVEKELRMKVLVDAEKYVKSHPKEFADMKIDTAVSRALYLRSIGKAIF